MFSNRYIFLCTCENSLVQKEGEIVRKLVEPIKSKADIIKIENYLKSHKQRDYVIWVLGLNSGLRVSDIVGLNVCDVLNKSHIEIQEKKTGKRKKFLINRKLRTVLDDYTRGKDINTPLFVGKHGKRLNKKEVYRFINKACEEIGIKVNAGTHTMRKTFGYHHYQKYKDPVILQKIFNHSSQRITLMYIGVEQDEIDFSYKNFEL